MIVAAGLLAYGAVLALAGQVVFRRTAFRRAPRLGVLVWQLGVASVLVSWVLAGLVVAVPLTPLDGLGHLLAVCVLVVHQLAAGSAPALPRAVGLVVVLGILGRAGWSVGSAAALTYRDRLRHARVLRMVARPAPELGGALILDHPDATIYCLPGRLRQTVVSRGALQVLTRSELAAVLAHERAHLRARHHLAVLSVRAIARAFPRVPLFAAAAREVPVLVEMCADDAAARRHGTRAVVGALAALAAMRAPRGTLAAADSAAAARIERLVAPRFRFRSRCALSTAVVLLLTGPPVAAMASALVMALQHAGYCPVPLPA